MTAAPVALPHAAPAPGSAGASPIAIADTPFAAVLLFVAVAASFFVLREPSPHDLLMVAAAGTLFALGLRIPAGVALPAACLALVLAGYMIGGAGARYIDLSIQFMQITAYLTIVFVFVTAVVAASPDRALRAIWGGFLVAGGVSAFLGVAAYLDAVPNADLLLGAGRAKAFFNDPNVYGPFLVAPTLYAVWRMTTRGPAAALFFWGPLATLLALGLFLSFSRGAWAHLAVSALVFALLAAAAPETRGQRGRIVVIAIVLGLMITFAIGWALTIPEIREMLEHRFGLQSYDTRQGGRFSGQLEALKMALNNPFGIGPSNWGMVFGQDTHNIYLNVFVGGGLVSLIGLTGAFALTMVRGWRYALTGPRRGVFLVAYATLAGLFLEGLIVDINHWRHMYWLMGIVWGLMLAAPPSPSPAPAVQPAPRA